MTSVFDAGAMLYQLSYEATQLGGGQFVRLMFSREKNPKGKDIISFHFIPFVSRVLSRELRSHNLVPRAFTAKSGLSAVKSL